METTFATQTFMAPSKSMTPIQWLGVQWQGGFYAVSLHMIAAVFRAAHSEQFSEKKILDVEIHAGAAVFIKPFAACFDMPDALPGEQLQEERRWVLVLNGSPSSQTGCRVHQVVGPFWADPDSTHVSYDGKAWLKIRPIDVKHA